MHITEMINHYSTSCIYQKSMLKVTLHDLMQIVM